jgi:NAD(P)-dependent dehydrogenase (short-subunit alcohol dehydrogenase family)
MNATPHTPIALVTGGSRGLGREMALRLADQGSDLVITYRSRADEVAAVVAEIERRGRRAVALLLDVGDIASFPGFATAFRGALAERFGRERFDHLVNNAGIGVHAPIADTT